MYTCPRFCHVLSRNQFTAQVSVERLFSALKFILNPHRTSMKSDIITDILLIRLNIQKAQENI